MLTNSGSYYYFWWCPEPDKFNAAGHLADGVWIQHKKLTDAGVVLNGLREVAIHQLDRCARCGSRGAERHHWAPQSMFSDPDAWPTDMLCSTCHREWHLIVTPGLVLVRAAK